MKTDASLFIRHEMMLQYERLHEILGKECGKSGARQHTQIKKGNRGLQLAGIVD